MQEWNARLDKKKLLNLNLPLTYEGLLSSEVSQGTKQLQTAESTSVKNIDLDCTAGSVFFYDELSSSHACYVINRNRIPLHVAREQFILV